MLLHEKNDMGEELWVLLYADRLSILAGTEEELQRYYFERWPAKMYSTRCRYKIRRNYIITWLKNNIVSLWIM